MVDANWIFADLIGLVVGISYIVVSSVFMDDLRRGFYWTKARTYWTQGRIGLSETGFRAFALCKTTISASAQVLLNAAPDQEGIRRRDAVLAGCSGFKLGKSALWCELRVRRWGERFLPHAAVGPIHLKPTQQRAVAALTADPASELTRGQYEELAGVSRSQAAYDLADLVEAGIIERVGNGRATRYRLARERGPQRRWTSDRIRTELEAFCAGRKTWPSAADFKAAGRGDLYVAASRYGGVGLWTEKLGFSRPPRGAATAPQPALFRTRLAWAGGGALAALCVAVALGAVVLTVTRHGTHVASPGELSQEAVTSDESIHPSIAATAEARQRRAHRMHRQPAKHSPTAPSRRGSSGPSRSLASYRSSPQPSATTAPVSATRTFSTVTPASSGWPAPLRAPSGGSAPPPLKAP
jgi:DNA-binding transcriptional ArsR family regulator